MAIALAAGFVWVAQAGNADDPRVLTAEGDVAVAVGGQLPDEEPWQDVADLKVVDGCLGLLVWGDEHPADTYVAVWPPEAEATSARGRAGVRFDDATLVAGRDLLEYSGLATSVLVRESEFADLLPASCQDRRLLHVVESVEWD